MDFFNKTELIKKTLNQNNYKNISESILDAQLSGGTRGEVLLIVCSKLLDIKKANSKAYLLIKENAEELCKEHRA